jgi:hypothetical protein
VRMETVCRVPTSRRQAVPALQPARLKHRTAPAGGHASSEPVRPRPLTLVRLIGALHRFVPSVAAPGAQHRLLRRRPGRGALMLPRGRHGEIGATNVLVASRPASRRASCSHVGRRRVAHETDGPGAARGRGGRDRRRRGHRHRLLGGADGAHDRAAGGGGHTRGAASPSRTRGAGLPGPDVSLRHHSRERCSQRIPRTSWARP